MSDFTLPTRFTAKQLYELWSSEPDLLQVIDLRPAPEFIAGHIPGALSLTRTEFAGMGGTMIAQLPADKLAVLISSDPDFCLDWLAQHKFQNVVVLDDLQQWQAQGFPITETEVTVDKAKVDKANVDKFKVNIIIDRAEAKGEANASAAKMHLIKETPMNETELIFHQLFEHSTSTYTYLLADATTKEAVIIDPVLETVDRDLKLVDELGLKVIYVLDTHIHADHITGASEIRLRTGAKTAVSAAAKVKCVDVPLEDGQQIRFGKFTIKALSTPGHTDSCMSFQLGNRIFTGDVLLIRGSGRTDFQQGSSEKLYDSVHKKVFILPDETEIYPGHDYRGYTKSTIGLEKRFNPRLGGGRSKEQFIDIMSELKLPYPKKIDEALPANLVCGVPKKKLVYHPQVVDGVPEITCEDVHEHLGKAKIVDVRRPDEYNNEYGHIPGAELVTLGDPLLQFLHKEDREREIVFVCRSGARSGQAQLISQQLGYKHTINMAGGMIRWNEKKFKVERN